ncbi:AbfB domain-containing protein [Streptoalloteichus hindustanus]|uniref:Peptidase S1 domain-containing protein n=1 Tax=Streptoalloteichus hindustanus TaxID=2017 RepID=A0A1M5I4F5_STRHI|nr:AbfB domain-containing protein [Streptoalloteichus hindustanus]SHG23152.1 Short repeat-containing protein of unknown function [Streptoalloteichus hindustanus]
MTRTRSTAVRVAVALAATLGTGLLASTPAQAVSGGTPAPAGAYQYAAKIEFPERACSGALVDPEWVITAKSCVRDVAPDAGKVIVGRTDLASDTGQVVKIASAALREDRDLALVKLATPVSGVTPIAITRTAPRSGETLQVAGFGRTATEWVPNKLQVAPFQVANVGAVSLEASAVAPARASTCKGDAGGPAVREANGGHELVAVGLGSWQGGCLGETETRQGISETRVDGLTTWLNQAKVQDIRTRAERGGVNPALVAAATAALAGTDADVEYFLREGQYKALRQSIRATTPFVAGFYVRHRYGQAFLVGGADLDEGTKLDATWKIVPGLADPSCFSIEAVNYPGSYMRHQHFRVLSAGNDGSELFRRDATWCARKPLAGTGVSFESLNMPGRYLRHIHGELWIANNTGEFPFDNPSAFAEDATWSIADPLVPEQR